MARLGEVVKEKSYRAYVTDTLRMIAENTAVPAASFTDGKMGQYIPARWLEALTPPREETRTPEEIIAGIRKSLKD